MRRGLACASIGSRDGSQSRRARSSPRRRSRRRSAGPIRAEQAAAVHAMRRRASRRFRSKIGRSRRRVRAPTPSRRRCPSRCRSTPTPTSSGAEAFEEATKVRALDELDAQRDRRRESTTSSAIPLDELSLRRQTVSRRLDARVFRHARSRRTPSSKLPVPDRDSAPALPSLPAVASRSNSGRDGQKLLDTSPSPRHSRRRAHRSQSVAAGASHRARARACPSPRKHRAERPPNQTRSSPRAGGGRAQSPVEPIAVRSPRAASEQRADRRWCASSCSSRPRSLASGTSCFATPATEELPEPSGQRAARDATTEATPAPPSPIDSRSSRGRKHRQRGGGHDRIHQRRRSGRDRRHADRGERAERDRRPSSTPAITASPRRSPPSSRRTRPIRSKRSRRRASHGPQLDIKDGEDKVTAKLISRSRTCCQVTSDAVGRADRRLTSRPQARCHPVRRSSSPPRRPRRPTLRVTMRKAGYRPDDHDDRRVALFEDDDTQHVATVEATLSAWSVEHPEAEPVNRGNKINSAARRRQRLCDHRARLGIGRRLRIRPRPRTGPGSATAPSRHRSQLRLRDATTADSRLLARRPPGSGSGEPEPDCDQKRDAVGQKPRRPTRSNCRSEVNRSISVRREQGRTSPYAEGPACGNARAFAAAHEVAHRRR